MHMQQWQDPAQKLDLCDNTREHNQIVNFRRDHYNRQDHCGQRTTHCYCASLYKTISVPRACAKGIHCDQVH